MLEEVAAQQAANEQARHRCVGLVVETRPDAVTLESLTLLRRFGCTKVQMGCLLYTSIGCWEPVSTMGLGLPWIRYESCLLYTSRCV